MELWQINRIKELENSGQWSEAAEQWRLFGRIEDAETCELIAESIEKGNDFRRRVKEQIGDEPDKETDTNKWLKWHKDLMAIK